MMFLIRTEILAFDPQPGMKSEQTITVDFGTCDVRSSFVTGTTKLLGMELESVRNNFVIEKKSFDGNTATFTAVGSTATGVHVLPNIDYKLTFTVNADGSGHVSGAHDGYPAYTVMRAGQKIYEFQHKSMNLHKLGGDLDIKVKQTAFGKLAGF